VIALAASSALFAQSSGTSPGRPQNQQGIAGRPPDRGVSVAATERSCRPATITTLISSVDEDRRLDSRGQVKSEDVDVTRMILVTGVRFEQLIEPQRAAPSAEQRGNAERSSKN